jgi:hypothetical protein
MEIVALLAVALIAVAFFAFRSASPPKKERRLPAPISDEDRARLRDAEAKAGEIARAIFEGALLTLREARIAASMPVEEWNEELRAEGLSLYTGTGRGLIGAAKDLAETWAKSPEGRDLAYLRRSLEARYPILLAYREDTDPSRLTRAVAGTRRDAAAAFVEALHPWIEGFSRARKVLEEHPDRVWSSTTLATLTILRMGDDAPSDAALTAHIMRVGREDDTAREMEKMLGFALRVLGTAPTDRRKLKDGYLAVPLDDLALGALLVRFQANGAEAPLDQADLVTRGAWRFLWLALDLVEAIGFEKAGRAFLELMPKLADALREEAALAAVEEKVSAALPADAAARVMETLRGMREGKSPEELRGGSPGHERRALEEAQAEMEREVAEIKD